MRYCGACGSKVEAVECFCDNCGHGRGVGATPASGQRRGVSKCKWRFLVLVPLFLVLFAGVPAGCLVPVVPDLVIPVSVAIGVPGDFPTIQAAINAAEDGDVIVVEPGTYRENIDFIGKGITVRSTAPDDPQVVAATVIDGGNIGSVVTFRGGETAESVLSGFTITCGSGTWEVFEVEWEGQRDEVEGYFGGGILVIHDSSPAIENNIITGNTAEFGGGGIAVIFGSSPAITANTITENTAGFGGGILVMHDSSPAIENNTITENTAGGGGGIGVVIKSSPAITANTITGNRADGGGGIAVVMKSSPAIENNIITGNTAREGGGIAVVMKSFPAIKNNTITDNAAEIGGGILVMYDSSPAIENNTITGNTAEVGGGILVMMESSPAVTGNTITGNTAEEGGGIWVSADSTLQLKTPDDNVYRNNVPDDIYHE